MSTALCRATVSEQASPPRPSALLHAVAAIVFPFDGVLSGMVAAGLGVQALCLFLGLSEQALDDSLVRLGLHRPHDRPISKQGKRGWTALDTMRLIVWRVACIHPEVIAQRLGRSVGAVRSKARRLGIPVPNRKDLRRVEPTRLRDPEPGWFFSGTAAVEPAGNSLFSADAASPGDKKTHRPRRAAVEKDVVVPHPVAASTTPSLSRAKRTSGTAALQREMPFFGVVPAQPNAGPVSKAPVAPGLTPSKSTASNGPEPSRAIATAHTTNAVHRTKADLPAESDLAWVGRTRWINANEAAISAISMRYFGGQHPKYIARDAGMSESALHGVLYRANLPRDRNRSKFGEAFDLEMAEATLEASGYVLVRDKTGVGRETGRGHLFWKHKRDRGVTTTRAARFRNGQLDDYDKYKGQEITLLTRRNLEEPDLDFDFDAAPRRSCKDRTVPPPFAKHPATLPRSHTSHGLRP